MSLDIAEHELYRACEIIFGCELTITREFLEYLQPSGIKSAYRKRAMESHPDRLASQGELMQQQGSELFQTIQEAYENLTTYLKAREQGFRLSPIPARPQPAPRRRAPEEQRARAKKTDQRQASARTQGRQKFQGQDRQYNAYWDMGKMYCGSLPNRRLLLGHFLYYSGVADWRTIVQALIWQRTQRPRLGEIGRRFGILNKQDILCIMRRKEFLQPFGKSAVTLGLLTEAQLKMLIFYQKRLQKKFGEFFIEKKILHPVQLQQILKRCHEHNTRLAEERTRSGSRF